MEIERINSTTSLEHVDTIIADIQDHIDKKQDFVGFILVALGIEFLGSFYDSKDFNDHGQSEIRFKNGISLFKNNWYKNNADWIFKNFRGPLIHQYRVGEGLLLTSFCKNGAPKTDHLKDINGNRLFVLDTFFDDFKLAAKKLKNEATKKQNSLNSNKLSQDYLGIYGIKDPSSYSISFENTTSNTLTDLLYGKNKTIITSKGNNDKT